MQISIYPLYLERSLGIGDFVMSFMLMSKGKGLKCRPMPAGAIIEGDKETLLEILEELGGTSLFSARAEKVSIIIRLDESFDKSLTQAEIEFLNGEISKVDATIARSF
jgi:Uncharacterized conserved protein